VFKHLVVPLDGSRLAEAALPAAAYLAQHLAATVTLLHIIEHDAPPAVHGEHHLTNPDEAYAYLGQVRGRFFPAGQWPAGRVIEHVHLAETADVAVGIVEHEGELVPDLIVMCTHGSGGLRDVLFGSIAQQVVNRGATPVLLIRPTEAAEATPFVCRRLLAPLDGQAAHEHGLPAAAELARACEAELRLVFVVPTLGTLSGHQAATGRLLPRATNAMLELAQEHAEEYLRGHVARLQAMGVTVSAEVQRGDPSVIIVDAAHAAGADMIVLGTHGRTGLAAFWARSTAAKVSGRSDLALLLVPVLDAPDERPLTKGLS
jgi:nucleotide-binding universal stress UspA family protein